MKNMAVCLAMCLLVISMTMGYAMDGNLGPKAAQPAYPSLVDIHVDSEGRIFVLDQAQTLRLLDKDGKQEWLMPLYGASASSPMPDYARVMVTRWPNQVILVGAGSGILRVSASGEAHANVPKGRVYKGRTPDAGGSILLAFPNKEKNRIEQYGAETSGPQGDYPGQRQRLTDAALDFGEAWIATCLIDGGRKGPGRLNAPYRVDIAGSNIWVLDADNEYKVFDLSGGYLRTVKPPAVKDASFANVIDVESDADGNVYVAFAKADSIVKYDAEGKLVQTLSLKENPRAFGLGPEGSLYVGVDVPAGGERSRPAIRVLDETGKVLRTIELYPDGKTATGQEARRKKEDDIREAVLRHQFENNASGQQQNANAYYLSVADFGNTSNDPSEEFMERFAGHRPPVKKVSESEIDLAGVKDKKTGEEGIIFRVETIRWLSDTKVEADGGYYEGNVSSSGNTYTVEYKDGKWVVVKDVMHWIS